MVAFAVSGLESLQSHPGVRLVKLSRRSLHPYLNVHAFITSKMVLFLDHDHLQSGLWSLSLRGRSGHLLSISPALSGQSKVRPHPSAHSSHVGIVVCLGIPPPVTQPTPCFSRWINSPFADTCSLGEINLAGPRQVGAISC